MSCSAACSMIERSRTTDAGHCGENGGCVSSLATSSGSRPVTTTKKPRCDDPYKACEFNDPEDFYDYYYDDFEDYEEAYDYYYDHQHD